MINDDDEYQLAPADPPARQPQSPALPPTQTRPPHRPRQSKRAFYRRWTLILLAVSLVLFFLGGTLLVVGLLRAGKDLALVSVGAVRLQPPPDPERKEWTDLEIASHTDNLIEEAKRDAFVQAAMQRSEWTSAGDELGLAQFQRQLEIVRTEVDVAEVRFRHAEGKLAVAGAKAVLNHWGEQYPVDHRERFRRRQHHEEKLAELEVKRKEVEARMAENEPSTGGLSLEEAEAERRKIFREMQALQNNPDPQARAAKDALSKQLQEAITRLNAAQRQRDLDGKLWSLDEQAKWPQEKLDSLQPWKAEPYVVSIQRPRFPTEPMDGDRANATGLLVVAALLILLVAGVPTTATAALSLFWMREPP